MTNLSSFTLFWLLKFTQKCSQMLIIWKIEWKNYDKCDIFKRYLWNLTKLKCGGSRRNIVTHCLCRKLYLKALIFLYYLQRIDKLVKTYLFYLLKFTPKCSQMLITWKIEWKNCHKCDIFKWYLWNLTKLKWGNGEVP